MLKRHQKGGGLRFLFIPAHGNERRSGRFIDAGKIRATQDEGRKRRNGELCEGDVRSRRGFVREKGWKLTNQTSGLFTPPLARGGASADAAAPADLRWRLARKVGLLRRDQDGERAGGTPPPSPFLDWNLNWS